MVLLYFITELNFDFVEKNTAIDEVSDGKIGVVEQVVKGLCQMQVFGQFLVEAFVPVRRGTIHPDKFVKVVGIWIVVSSQLERECHAAFVQQVPS